MFDITEIQTLKGVVVVEDIEMGLRFEFNMPKVMIAMIVDDYELEMVDIAGNRKKVRSKKDKKAKMAKIFIQENCLR